MSIIINHGILIELINGKLTRATAIINHEELTLLTDFLTQGEPKNRGIFIYVWYHS